MHQQYKAYLPADAAGAVPPARPGVGPFPYGYFRPPEPAVHLDDDNETITLLEPLRYTTPGGVTHTAPAGLRCDGASIPRALWSIVGSPYTGPYRLAAIIHDALCQQARAIGGRHGWRLRLYADVVFRSAIRANGGSSTRAGYMFVAVRAHAWIEFARGVYRPGRAAQ